MTVTDRQPGCALDAMTTVTGRLLSVTPFGAIIASIPSPENRAVVAERPVVDRRADEAAVVRNGDGDRAAVAAGRDEFVEDRKEWETDRDSERWVLENDRSLAEREQHAHEAAGVGADGERQRLADARIAVDLQTRRARLCRRLVRGDRE